MTRETLFAVSRLRSCSIYSEIPMQVRNRRLRPFDAHPSAAFPLPEPRVHLFVGNCFASVGGHHAVSHFASEPFVVGYEVVNRLSQQFVRAPVGSLGQFIESSLRLGRQI